jgi:nitroimidazol reductase NimA-like FMN-containing flavoprotein (pyridoxamine 5'-phosphate oxidase superfamily)
MIEKIKAILRENNVCVLATCSAAGPHCSFMGYVPGPDEITLYMVTLKTTKKYANIMENSQVSVLADTRIESFSRPAEIRALTVSGVCSPVREAQERQWAIARIMETHPHLSGLAAHPDAEVLAVRAESFLLLDGPLDAHFEKVR